MGKGTTSGATRHCGGCAAAPSSVPSPAGQCAEAGMHTTFGQDVYGAWECVVWRAAGIQAQGWLGKPAAWHGVVQRAHSPAAC